MLEAQGLASLIRLSSMSHETETPLSIDSELQGLPDSSSCSVCVDCQPDVVIQEVLIWGFLVRVEGTADSVTPSLRPQSLFRDCLRQCWGSRLNRDSRDSANLSHIIYLFCLYYFAGDE